MSIARVAIAGAALPAFDYWIPDGLDARRGSIVRVALGRRRGLGVVMDLAADSGVARERLRSIDEVIDLPPLPEELLQLASFVAAYYHEPIGSVIGHVLPPLGRSLPRDAAQNGWRLTDSGAGALPALTARAPARRAFYARLAEPAGINASEAAQLRGAARQALADWRAAGYVQPLLPAGVQPAAVTEGPRLPTLNAAQATAVAALVATAKGYEAFLLQGVTGSGKTAVYLAAAAARIAAGGQVLMLVPEINLTPQLEHELRAALPGVSFATLHSNLAAGDRVAGWLAAARGTARFVLGTRLAIFAPMPDLALIVIDEEHDPSYKQQDGVRYHARDVAIWRAHARGVPIVLGSATPSLETYQNARLGRYRTLGLPTRAIAEARPPQVTLVPARDPLARDGITPPLWLALAARLAAGEQSLVFVNRRGFSPALKCLSCSWEAHCPRCSARLTLHRAPSVLRCHHCGYERPVPAACPDCGNVDLLAQGHGTQRLESALAAAYPAARIVRVDRDSMRRKNAFAAVRERVVANEVDILIGTQMLAKGHDFPRLTLVGVLGADNALYSADFRATERLGALLAQVGGRAGRAGRAGEVLVQTDFPDHPVYRALVDGDYDAFARGLLREREAAQLPPLSHLALLAGEAHRRDDVNEFLAAAHAAALVLVGDDARIDINPPVSALLARRAGYERGQVLVSASERGRLQQFLGRWRAEIDLLPGRRVRWSLDVDPASF
jgi:primosomal protein N' (replication factor Y)